MNKLFHINFSNRKIFFIDFPKDHSTDFQSYLQEFSKNVSNFLKLEMYPLIALIQIFSSFDYLITQKKTLISDLTEQDDNYFEKYTSEIHQINKDKNFLILIPDIIRFGLYNVNIGQTKKILIENCEGLVLGLQNVIFEKFINIVK